MGNEHESTNRSSNKRNRRAVEIWMPLEMHSDSPYQLGTLASERFSEQMMSAVNLLVNVHRAHLDYDYMDIIIF